jgi:ArsR family transcriptional regulator
MQTSLGLPGSSRALTSSDRRRFAAVGRALADEKRLCVLECLASSGEASVSDLSIRVGCQVPNMSQHLSVLRSAGLVTSRRDGNTIFYRLSDPRVLEAYELIQAIAR